MASASAGLELPATSLIAPLLPAIPALLREYPRNLIQAACRAGNMNQGIVPAAIFSRASWLIERANSQWRMPVCCSLLGRQSDGVYVAAVIDFGAMRGAAVAEKSVGVGIGAQAKIFDLADTGPLQPRRDIAAEIEQGMARARRGREKPVAGAILGAETGDQIGTDFIIGLPDHGADGGADVAARGAEPFHRLNRRLDHARERAAPAGMRCANHMPLRIGEENRSAVRRGHADGERAHAGYDCVGAGPGVGGPGRF